MQQQQQRTGDKEPRLYTDFAIYKGKTACKLSVVKPTFEPLANGSRQKTKNGGVVFEFAPSVGPRSYDWGQKQAIMLSPLEFIDLTESLHVGRGVAFFHDPGMGTSRQGVTNKTLKAEPMPDGSGGIFLNFFLVSAGAGGAPGGGSHGKISMNIAVSFAEFAMLRALAQYLSPRLMGFAEAGCARFRVQGLEFRVQSSGFRVQSSVCTI